VARLLYICLGGALGTGARYLLSGALLRALGPSFPVGTLAVNVIGSFLLSLIMQLSLATTAISPTVRLVLTTGFLGGFTTYSTFNYESLSYFEQGAWGLGLLDVSVTVFACMAAGVLGLWSGRALGGA
jgi:CrcB protein